MLDLHPEFVVNEEQKPRKTSASERRNNRTKMRLESGIAEIPAKLRKIVAPA